MKIDISIEMPKDINDNYKQQSICEKARDYMDCCESDEDSGYHFRYLRALYNKLHKLKKLPPKYHQLMGELEAFMSKYGIYDSGEGQADMTGENMFKFRDEV